MFCPSCGTESTGLNYCNRCGANLSAALSTTVDLPPVNLTKPILILGAVATLLTLGGFFMILAAATTLATRTGAGGDLPMAIVFFGMITVLILDILLLRQMSKLINAALYPGGRAKEKRSAPQPNTSQLSQPSPALLAPRASITENTTRFFDTNSPLSTPEPVPLEKK